MSQAVAERAFDALSAGTKETFIATSLEALSDSLGLYVSATVFTNLANGFLEYNGECATQGHQSYLVITRSIRLNIRFRNCVHLFQFDPVDDAMSVKKTWRTHVQTAYWWLWRQADAQRQAAGNNNFCWNAERSE